MAASTNVGTAATDARASDQRGSRPYFPQSGARHNLHFGARSVPSRVDMISLILDHEHAQVPLLEYDAIAYNRHYSEPSSDGLAKTPPPPENFSDSYLHPTLTREERLRLTVLWYYTRYIEQDEIFLSKIDGITATVQAAIGWDFALVGISDEALYTPLATASFPLAYLPRRESICSHTINQKLGSVFMSTDLANDWRFQAAPHIKVGGLRSYAGTQLLLTTNDGREVALGSLCVVSKSTQQPLTAKQRALLVHYADIVSWEMTERTRQLRSKERIAMTESLLSLRSQVDQINLEAKILEVLQEQYPGGHVTIQNSASGALQLIGRPSVLFSHLQGNLWEDTPSIELAIKVSNYKKLSMAHPIRMVAARCGNSNKYIVVTTNDVQHVLDDLDAWFVEKCAELAAEALQNQLLTQALDAKEAFLRNITHQLRTPIHGILGSLDLLVEELECLKASEILSEPLGRPLHAASSAYIAAIRSSGRELMTTVNNILRFNTLTTQPRTDGSGSTSYDLRNLGSEMISDILQMVPEEQLSTVSIQIKCNLSFEQSMANVSGRWLKECIQPLLLNSLQSVLRSKCGLVTMAISYDLPSKALCFDFKDTGIGINKADQGRIFSAFERVDSYKSGLGLGLTLSRGIAERHNGSISLVASLEGYGSHFRARFPDQIVLPPSESSSNFVPLPHISNCFHVLHCDLQYSYMIHHMSERLEQYGFQNCSLAEASLIITDVPPDTDEFARLCSDRQRRTIIITAVANTVNNRIRKPNQHTTVLVVTGPFYDESLDNLFRQADVLYADLVEPVLTSTPSPVESRTEASYPQQQVSSIDLTTQTSRTPTKALLVDDNIINLRILEVFCRKRKIPYVLACDGLKAEEEYRKAAKTSQPIDLVFMDLQMPVCDGTKATCAIRLAEQEEPPILPRPTIFIVTGQDSPVDKLQSEQAGADEFLVKPVSLKVLDEHIMKHFSGYTKK